MTTDINKYLPHRYPMQLIDSILDVNAKLARCRTTVTTNNIFYDPIIGGIYSWVGLELMAQTAGIFAYLSNPQTEPQVGFLISMRKFSCEQLFFKLDDMLIITAENIYMQEGVGVFDCQIELNGDVVTLAKLTAIQPAPQQNK